MSLKIILDRVVYPNVKKLNFNGIELEVVEKIKKEDYSVGEYLVLVYEIYNPLDLPYTKISLQSFIDEKIKESFKLTSRSAFSFSISPSHLWEFSDNVKEIYIPKKYMSEIKECISSSKFTMKVDVPYLVKGNIDYVIDINYGKDVSLSVYYGEIIQIEFDVFVSNIRKKIDKDNYVMDDDYDTKSEIRERILNIDNYREYIQDDIYRCMSEIILIPTLYSRDWMGFDFSFNIIFK